MAAFLLVLAELGHSQIQSEMHNAAKLNNAGGGQGTNTGLARSAVVARPPPGTGNPRRSQLNPRAGAVFFVQAIKKGADLISPAYPRLQEARWCVLPFGPGNPRQGLTNPRRPWRECAGNKSFLASFLLHHGKSSRVSNIRRDCRLWLLDYFRVLGRSSGLWLAGSAPVTIGLLSFFNEIINTP
jgi:hypothetical protein